MQLISVATGRRPRTAEVSLKAMWLHIRDRVLDEKVIEFHVVRWDKTGPEMDGPRNLWLEGGGKPQCLNLSLETFKREHDGELPRTWFTLDDDAVWGMGLTERMEAVLAQDERIGLLGAANEGMERGRGSVQMINTGHEICGSEEVQYGTDFCVGGATHAIPRRTLEQIPKYPDVWPRREDELLTQQVRVLGMQACIARTISVAMLPDDRVDPEYRSYLLKRHYVESV